MISVLKSGISKDEKIKYLTENFTSVSDLINLLDSASNNMVSSKAFNANWKAKDVYFKERYDACLAKGDLESALKYKKRLEKVTSPIV